MDVREEALLWIERQLWSINETNGFPVSVAVVARGPVAPFTRFPAVAIFEFDDRVKEPARRMPNVMGRELEVLVEFWIKDSGDVTALSELRQAIRWVLLGEQPTGTVPFQVIEKGLSPVIKPVIGKVEVMGQGMTLAVSYAEVVSDPRRT